MTKEKEKNAAPGPAKCRKPRGIGAAILKTAVYCLIPVGFVALIPAIQANLEAAAGQPDSLVNLAIGSVVAAALFIEAAVLLPGRGVKAGCALLASLPILYNVSSAIGNSATGRGHSRDNNIAIQQNAANAASNAASLKNDRAVAVNAANHETPDMVQGEIDALIAKARKLWDASNECKDPKGKARVLCEEYGKLKTKLAAAEQVREIDKKLNLPQNQTTGPVVTSVDPYADSMANFLATLGIQGADKKVISSSRDWHAGIVMEAIASFGPAVWTAVIMFMGGRLSGENPAAQEKPARKKRPEESVQEEALQGDSVADPEIDTFYNRCLEAVQGEYMEPKAIYAAWQKHCAECGIEPGGSIAFSKRIRLRVGYEKTAGKRARYMHIKLREMAKPKLRVVSN
jgi:hypothetical protein